MKHNFELHTEKIQITPLCADEIESLRILRNKVDNRKWFFSNELITEEKQKKWYEFYLSKSYDYMFSVKQGGCNNTQVFTGSVAIYNYDEVDNSMEVGRLLLDVDTLSYPGRGTELVRCACYMAFNQISGSSINDGKHIYKLTAEVFADNVKSLNCFKNNGFRIVGHKTINNRGVDCFAVTKEEFYTIGDK